MTILTASELPIDEPISCFIYGQPGIGKTVAAESAPNPILFDFDRGLKRVSQQFIHDFVSIKKWEDAIEALHSDKIKQFDSIIIDTLGYAIELAFDYASEQSPKLKGANGTPTTQGWGTIKNMILNFHREVMKLNKHVIYIAHDKEEGRDDETKKIRPDAAGSSCREIIKQMDIVGYMSIRDDKRTICFNPTDNFIAKNSLGLAGYISVPTVTNFVNNNFFTKLIEDLKLKRAKENEERIKFDAILAEQDEQISHVETMQDLLVLLEAQKEKATEEIWGSKAIMWGKIKKLAKDKFGMVYDNASKQFIEEANNA